MYPQWRSLNFAALFAKGAAFVNTDAQNSILNPNGVLSFKNIWQRAREQDGSLHNVLRLAAACRSRNMPLLWLSHRLVRRDGSQERARFALYAGGDRRRLRHDPAAARSDLGAIQRLRSAGRLHQRRRQCAGIAILGKMAELGVDEAPRFRLDPMVAACGTASPAALRVAPILVFQSALQDEQLFAAGMVMFGHIAAR